jgi:hypothetical protein
LKEKAPEPPRIPRPTPTPTPPPTPTAPPTPTDSGAKPKRTSLLDRINNKIGDLSSSLFKEEDFEDSNNEEKK